MVSFEGIVEGVGGLGAINAAGVFGGSKLGLADFHASRNFRSTEPSACVANGRPHLIAVALARESNRGA